MSERSQGWEYHYKKAEALLNESYSPNQSAETKERNVARALVHATLASMHTNPSPERLPETFG